MSFESNFFRDNPPSVFISYCWFPKGSEEWARQFVIRLKEETGCRVVFDQNLYDFGDRYLNGGGDIDVFMNIASEVDYVIPIWTDEYLRRVRQDSQIREAPGVLIEHEVICRSVIRRHGEDHVIPVFRQKKGAMKSPIGALDRKAGARFPIEDTTFPEKDKRFQIFRDAILPSKKAIPLHVFKKDFETFWLYTGARARNVTPAKTLQKFGKATGQTHIYANEKFVYDFRWSDDGTEIIAEAEQTYQVINLTSKPVKREVFWKYKKANAFVLRSYECWNHKNDVIAEKHYATNPLTILPDGVNLEHHEPDIEIAPWDGKGAGRIWCRVRWSVCKGTEHMETLSAEKLIAVNVRIKVRNLPDDIAVTVTGHTTHRDEEAKLWLFRNLIHPQQGIQIAWSSRRGK